MEIGDEKTFSLGPDMAYGYRDDELVRSIPRSIAGSQFKPEVGMTIGIQMEDDTKMPTNITQVTDDSITIDMNSPLAGKTLNFKIQVVDISNAPSCGWGCGSSCGSGGGESSSCGCC
ncbi:MAG: FKBP-type peptidyl-prolyl cis-trans isomerase [Dissulfurimicrobium sp.]|uniref:FKBP-type peptidyl-prolyl cis-trans isomerase n=1 Tax=Dissulfurimicrobium sp. TaxID=2022436 RepID=UPI00404A6752